jgi:hypothetical protein
VNGNSITKNGPRESESRTPIGRAIAWLQHYADAQPYTGGAEEAQSIINELRAVRNRPALDELLALKRKSQRLIRVYRKYTGQNYR